MSSIRLTQKKKPRKRYTHRPNGAYKLLTYLLYSKYTFLERLPRGYIRLRYIAKLARILGSESKHVRNWIQFLQDQGYLQDLSYSQNRRSVQFRVRPISSIHNLS